MENGRSYSPEFELGNHGYAHGIVEYLGWVQKVPVQTPWFAH